MIYILIILGAMLLITLTNTALTPMPDLSCLASLGLSTLLGTVSIILWDGLVAFAIRRLPERFFLPERTAFHVSRQEKLLYRRLHINSWKCCVPELGCFTGFSKSEFSAPRESSYIRRFLLESNYGVLIHVANAALGWLIVFLPWCSDPCIAFPIALVNTILSLLPVAVLRFHTLPLLNIYKRELKKEAASTAP